MTKDILETEEDNLIRAAAYLPSPEDLQARNKAFEEGADIAAFDMLALPEHDSIMYGIFGDFPDYSNPEIDDVFEEVLESDSEEIYEYCFKKGIDVFDVDGEPVPPWRDIAVMLLCIDRGLVELA